MLFAYEETCYFSYLFSGIRVYLYKKLILKYFFIKIAWNE